MVRMNIRGHLRTLYRRAISPWGVAVLFVLGVMVYYLPKMLALPVRSEYIISGIGSILVMISIGNSLCLFIYTENKLHMLAKIMILAVLCVMIVFMLIPILRTH